MHRSLPPASLAMPWSQSSSSSRKLKSAPRPWANSCQGACSSRRPVPDRPQWPAHPRGGKKDTQQRPRPLGGSWTRGGRCGQVQGKVARDSRGALVGTPAHQQQSSWGCCEEGRAHRKPSSQAIQNVARCSRVRHSQCLCSCMSFNKNAYILTKRALSSSLSPCDAARPASEQCRATTHTKYSNASLADSSVGQAIKADMSVSERMVWWPAYLPAVFCLFVFQWGRGCSPNADGGHLGPESFLIIKAFYLSPVGVWGWGISLSRTTSFLLLVCRHLCSIIMFFVK